MGALQVIPIVTGTWKFQILAAVGFKHLDKHILSVLPCCLYNLPVTYFTASPCYSLFILVRNLDYWLWQDPPILNIPVAIPGQNL